jgi:hypothetical protein
LILGIVSNVEMKARVQSGRSRKKKRIEMEEGGVY